MFACKTDEMLDLLKSKECALLELSSLSISEKVLHLATMENLKKEIKL